MLPFREHPPLFVAGQPAGEPGRQRAAADPDARKGHGGEMQRIEGRGLLCHCPKELKIQDAPNEAADAAGREKDHLIRKRKGASKLRKPS